MPGPKLVRLCANVLLAAGLIILAWVAGMHAYAQAYQFYLAWTLEPGVDHVRPAVGLREGMPIGRLEIPRLNLSVMVLEGVSERTLRLGAGHVPQTSLPGTRGNAAIAAHRDGFFRALRHVQTNDLIRVITRDGVFEYVVEWTRVVQPTAVEFLSPTSEPSLTLIPCYPFSYVGPAPERFIARARLISSSS